MHRHTRDETGVVETERRALRVAAPAAMAMAACREGWERPLPETQEEMRVRMRTYPTRWFMKLMRRLQIKSMTYKQRRKMPMYNGKRNKRAKETPNWK